jgi:hypothetical protein
MAVASFSENAWDALMAEGVKDFYDRPAGGRGHMFVHQGSEESLSSCHSDPELAKGRNLLSVASRDCLSTALGFSQGKTFSKPEKKTDSSPASRDRNDKSLLSSCHSVVIMISK